MPLERPERPYRITKDEAIRLAISITEQAGELGDPWACLNGMRDALPRLRKALES